VSRDTLAMVFNGPPQRATISLTGVHFIRARLRQKFVMLSIPPKSVVK